MYFPNKPTEEIIVDNPRWEVVLSNGEKCYHDESIPSCWQELRKYCKKKKLKVSELKIGFRDVVVDFPSGKDGYFFRMMQRQHCFGDSTFHFFVVGYIEDNILKVRKYKVPEMQLEEMEERDIKENKDSII